MKLLFHHKETRCLPIPYAQWVRCLHGLRPLLYEVRRRAPYTSLPSFLQDLDCISGFPCDFLLFAWSGGEWKRLTHGCLLLIIPFPMAILGKYDERLSIPQVFHIPLLYKSKKSRFCERENEKFNDILIFPSANLYISPERTLSLVIHKISKAGCKKRGLMQYI